MAEPRRTSQSSRTRRPPATTPEARENQLIAAAFDLAERQLLEGTASAQVITHYLKLGTVRENLERKKLESENSLLLARVANLESSSNSEALYAEAINAMKLYSGNGDAEDYAH